MIAYAAHQAMILADTSPFCRFAENGISEVFADYLGPKLCLTDMVVGELEHRAKQVAHRQLDTLARRAPPWTTTPIVTLDDVALKRADALARGWRRRQERLSGAQRDERANLGEAVTIVAAQETGCAVLLDEGKPRSFAEKKGLTVITTETITVELAAAGVLRPRPAFLIYKRVYGNDQASFDAAVELARNALGTLAA